MAIVGSASVTIRAITSKIEQDIVRGLRGSRAKVEGEGEIMGRRFGDAFTKGFKQRLREIDVSVAAGALRRQGQDAGRGFGDSFEAGFQKRLTEMGTGNALRHLRGEGRNAGDLFGQEFAVGFRQQMRNIDLTGLGSGANRSAGESAGRDYGDSFAKGFRASLPNMNTNILRARFRQDAHLLGELFGGEFIRGFNKSVKSMDLSALSQKIGAAGKEGGKEAVAEIEEALDKVKAEKAGDKAGFNFSRGFRRAFSGVADSPLAALATTASLAGNAIITAVAGLGSLVAGLTAVAGAAGLAAGSLIVIPGIIGSIVQVAGTLALAFKGVGEAISAGNEVADFKADASAVAAAARAVEAARRGVRDANQAMVTAQRETTRAMEDAERRIEEAIEDVAQARAEKAAEMVEAANKVTRAERDLGDAVIEAAENSAAALDDVNEATERWADVTTRAADNNATAAENVVRAQNRLNDANRDAVRAQEDLTQARADAIEQLQQLSFSLEDAVLSEERAEISLERAQERLAEVQALPADNRMRREAELAFKEAELNLRQAKDRTSDLAAENETAAAKGVEGSDLVVTAREREEAATVAVAEATSTLTEAQATQAQTTIEGLEAIADALAAVDAAKARSATIDARGARDVADAEAELADARVDAANVEIDAQNRIIDARNRLAEARRDAAFQEVENAERIRDAGENVVEAQDRLRDAQQRLNDAQNGGVTAAEKYRNALAELSPEAATFAGVIVGLKDDFQRLRDAAGSELFPKLGPAIQQVADEFFPVLEDILADTGSVVGDVAQIFADLLSEPFFQGQLVTIAEGNNRLFGRMGEAMANLAQAFATLMVAAQPLIDRFGLWIVDVTDRINDFFKATEADGGGLTDFFNRAGDAAAIFGGLFKEMGGLFVDVFAAGADEGLGLVQSLTDSIASLRDRLADADMAGYFAGAADNTRAIMRLLGGILEIFIKIGDNEAIGKTANELTERLLPNIERIVNAVVDEAAPALAEFAIAISEVVAELAESGAINAFVDALTDIVKVGGAVVGFLNDTGLLGPLLTILGVFKALKVALGFLGIAFGPLMSLFGALAKLLLKRAITFILFQLPSIFGALATALGIAVGPLIAIIAGVALLVAGFVLLYKKSETFRAGIHLLIDPIISLAKTIFEFSVNVVKWFFDLYDKLLGHSIIPDIVNGIIDVFNLLTAPIRAVIDLFNEIVIGGAQAVLDFFRNNWDDILGYISAPVEGAVDLVGTAWDKITGFFSAAWNWVDRTFSGLWDGVKDVLLAPVNLGKTLLENAFDFYFGENSIFKKAWNWVKGTFEGLWDGVTGILTAPVDAGKELFRTAFNFYFGEDSIFRKAWDWVRDTFSGLWAGVTAILTSPVDAAKATFQTLFGEDGTIRRLLNNFVDGVETIWNGLKTVMAAPINFVISNVYNKGLLRFWNAIADKVPGLGKLDPLNPIELAKGGVIPGYRPGKDTVPAMLSPGEAVLRPEVVRALGAGTIHAWNRWAMGGRRPGGPPEIGGRRHYYQGGVVAASTVGRGGFDWPWDQFKDALKTLDPRNIDDGLKHIKNVVVGALADSLRVLILRPLRTATNEFADSNSGTMGAFARVPGGLLTAVVSKMIDFLEGVDSGHIKKETAAGAILGSAGAGRWQFPLPQGSYRWGVGIGGYPGHTGQDLPAPRGTKIVSVGDGRVVISKDQADSYGRWMKIEHAGNIFTLYAHMLRRLAQVGQIVKRGQVIGEVDSTGNSSGDHLHFEYRPGDRPSSLVGTFLRNADATGPSDREHTAQGGRGHRLVSAQMVARIAASRYGWTGNEWEALSALVATDGGFTDWASHTGKVSGGVEAALEYIRRRYGAPSKALAAYLSKTPHVYHTGGWVGGRGEVPSLLQSGEYVFSRDQAARLRQGAVVMPTANGDLRVIADLAPGGLRGSENAALPKKAIDNLERLVDTLQKGGSGQTFVVQPAPGMDERELAAKVGREVAWKMVPR